MRHSLLARNASLIQNEQNKNSHGADLGQPCRLPNICADLIFSSDFFFANTCSSLTHPCQTSVREQYTEWGKILLKSQAIDRKMLE
mgnify:CR=1 FL=1